MSFRVFFDFSVGFSESITVPAGTHRKILEHIAMVEKTLGYEKEKHDENPYHWKSTIPKEGVSDEVFCEIVEKHNWFVESLYDDFQRWTKSPPTENTEIITPEQSIEFLYGLRLITVPFERWTKDYYENRMLTLYYVFRGKETEGVIFDEKPLTIKQARSVMVILQEYCGIDRFNLDLDVPRGKDELYPGEDLYWCEKCGWSVHYEDIHGCKKRKCPLRYEDEEDE